MKLRNRKARKRAQVGRPPKFDVLRKPSGQVAYPRAERKAEIMSTVTQARIRQYGVVESDAASQLSGYALGRLYLAGGLGKGISADEAAMMLQAGNRMHEDMVRYYGVVLGQQPNARAAEIMRVKGYGNEPRASAATKAANQMMKIEGALGMVDRQGAPVRSLCKRLIVHDEDAASWTTSMVETVKVGLRALIGFYGLRSV